MQSVYIRLALYVLSPLLTLLAPLLAGYGLSYDAEAQAITVALPTLIGAVVAALGLSGAVLTRWGVR